VKYAQIPATENDSEAHRQLARKVAREAMVLLKNDGDLLPFSAGGLKTLAVVGPNAAARRIQGGGSSQVRTDRQVSILGALRERLAGKVETDLDTARRLFTLICALHWRG